MGSYLSIVNNTPNQWHCRVGPDEKTISMIKIVAAAFTAAAMTATKAGAFVPGPAGLAISSGAAVAAGVGFATSAATEFMLTVIHGVQNELVNQGFINIPANSTHQYGKMAVSLWQMGTCVRSYALNDTETVRTETIYMRPIFSGAKADSNRDYDIQSWIDKHGVETQDHPRQQSNATTNTGKPSS